MLFLRELGYNSCCIGYAVTWSRVCGIRVPIARCQHIRRKKMKKDIHPSYGECIVRCACGETFKSGSVKGELKVEICSKCHPFYTGRQKLVDSGGRVDKFKKRYGMK